MIKKWDNHFPGGNSHLKAEQTAPQFQTTIQQVNLFKKGLGVGVPGNQHNNTYAQGKIKDSKANSGVGLTI